MNASTYHIEDLETLLLQKEYAALLPEEKTFVHQHIKDEQAYSQMRALLYKMIEESQDDTEWTDPDPRVKQNLDALFSPADNETPIIPFYQNKIFWSLTGIAALFLIGFFIFLPKGQENMELAEVQKPNAVDSIKANPSIENSAQGNSTPVPPPPPPIIQKTDFIPIEITEEEVASPPVEERIEQSLPVTRTPPVDIKESSNNGTAADQENAEPLFTYSENITYLAGDAQLQQDLAHIIQRCMEKSNLDPATPPSKIFVQLNILRDGQVQSVQILRGGENFPTLCQYLRADLKQLGKFRFPTQVNAASMPLTIPLNIRWQ
jgi:hypothetical protein